MRKIEKEAPVDREDDGKQMFFDANAHINSTLYPWYYHNTPTQHTPADGQLISLLSHTLGSIGQVLKDGGEPAKQLQEIERIYKGYTAAMQQMW